jgi:hypothetical protein
MKKFTVIVAVDVPSYGKVQGDAADDFDSDWSNCDNLRTI